MKKLKDFELFKIEINTIYGGNRSSDSLTVLQEQNTDDAGDDNEDEY